MPDLSLHEALAVLPEGELREIAERAASQAELCKASSDPYARGWAIVFAYISSSASYALAARELEISNV